MSTVSKASIESEAAEFRRLADLTQFAAIKQHLLAQATAKDAEASSHEEATSSVQDSSKVESAARKVVPRRRPHVVLSSYAWDQTKDDIKLYVTLAGVEDLPVENIELVSDSSSTKVEVSDLSGKDYSLTILLAKEINPSACKFKQRKGKLLITLRKADTGTWMYLTAKEQKAADARAPKLNKSNDDADPQASIMGMMKDMYQSGDEDMKRMIAKAWTESKDKK